MAFLTATTLMPRAAPQRAARKCTLRMEDASPPLGTMPVLNADKARAMKEPFELPVGKKAPVCRCWQSAKFPLCDGSHNALNKATGSNVGPLVVAATAE